MRSNLQLRNKGVYLGAIVAVLSLSVVGFSGVNAQSPTNSRQVTSVPKRVVPREAPTTGIDLTVSPVFLSLITDPGKTVSSVIKIRNNSNVREYLKLSLAKFEPVANGNPVITDVEEGDEFAEWIDFSESEFEIDSSVTKNIKVTINPSNDAALGYYYAIVVNRIEEADDATQPVIAGAPAIPVLLEVNSPNAKREVQLVDFKTDKAIYEYLPTEFQITLKNSGNIHSSPIGDIFIDWGSDKDLDTISVNSAKGNILPQSNRTFTAYWDNGFAVRVPKIEDGKGVTDKDGKAVFETKYDFTKADKFRIGKYTANLLLIYDNGERDIPLVAKVSFWVIPWKIILIVGVVLIFALLGIRSTLSSYIRKIRGK